jgi:hypothetical protein
VSPERLSQAFGTMPNLDTDAIRERAKTVQGSAPGKLSNTQPIKGNPDWPAYQLASCVIELCDVLDDLWKKLEANDRREK